jgi:peptide/nickel transport system substrate-binding protein
MKSKKKLLSLVVAAVLLMTTLASCGGGGNSADTPDGSALRFALRMDVASLNPLKVTTETDNYTSLSMFTPLFYYVIDPGEVRSDACTDWSVSDDAKSYTFVLKDGITFHNGESLTMEDVVYSVNQSIGAPANATWAANFDSVEVTGDSEVTITLKDSDANFFSVASIFLLHEKTVTEMGDDFDQNPIGSGPYEFVSYEPGYKLTLKKFEAYAGPAVDFDTLEFVVMTDPSAATIALENGEVDVIMSTAYVQYESMKANAKLKTHLVNFAVDLFIMNNQVAPYDNVKVRQALNYAVDKERASLAYSEGVAAPATSFIPWVTDASLTGYPYDPEKAKALLAEAGYPNGEGFPTIKIQTVEMFKIYAQTIQEDFAAIGINAEVELGEAASLSEQILSGNVPFCVYTISPGFDASKYSMVLGSGQPFNIGFYSNPQVDELFAATKLETDPAKSRQLFVDILKIVQDDAGYGMLCDNAAIYAYSANLDLDGAFADFTAYGLRPQDVKLA